MRVENIIYLCLGEAPPSSLPLAGEGFTHISGHASTFSIVLFSSHIA